MNDLSASIFHSFRNAFFYRSALFVFSFLLPFTNALALNEAPQTFTLDGRLYQTGTTSPLLDTAAKITVQILDPTGHCVLYEEQQTANTSGTEGYFNINVGSDTSSAKRTVNDPGRSMAQIFQNTVSISGNNASGLTCTAGIYTPTAGAVRYFRIIVTPSATNIADTLSPDLVLDSVPNAMVAQSVQGLERSSILQANNSGATVLTQANLEALFTTPGYTNLQAILGGNFIRTDSSGATLPAYAATPSGVAAGDIWYDSTTNQIKYQSNSGVQTVGAGGAGAISSLTMGSSMSVNGSVAGTISNGSGTIDLSNTGVSAGTYTKVTVDTKGRVTAGTISLVEADIPNLTIAGKVSGNTITSGTISGSAGINTSGNLITTATVSGLTVQATNLRIYNGSNYVQLSAPALGGNVNLTLPVDDGNAGEVLSTNGSGVLSWVSALTNTLASGKIFVGNGSNIATAVSMSGDGSLSNAGVLTIDSGTVANRLVRLDGSAKMPAVDGSALTNITASNISGTLPINKGGTAATTFAANSVIVSNGTGSALQALNCTLGQVVTFDASGYAVCGAGGSTGFVNGGNSFGAAASLGTTDNFGLHLKTNNNTRLSIRSNGDIGIGISFPSYALEISRDNSQATVLVKNTSSTSALYPGFMARDYTGTAGGYPVFAMMTSRGSESVPAPVEAGDTLGILLMQGTYNSSGNYSDASSIRTYAAENWSATNKGSYLTISTIISGATTLAERMRIHHNGYLGIGTIVPTTKLHIVGTSGATLKIVDGNQTAGHVLTSDANGVASWAAPAAGASGTVTAVTSANAYLTVATGTSTPVLTVNVGTGANTVAAGDDSRITGAAQKASNLSDLASASTARTNLGLGTAAVHSVGTSASNIVQLDGSSKLPTVDGSALTNITATNISGTLPILHGGTAATSFAANAVIISNGTGSALQALNCTINQIITFDVSGYAACGSIGTTAFINGGNSFAGNASIGTNDAYKLSIETSGTERMVILANGNVGIGESNPTATLDLFTSATAPTGTSVQANYMEANPISHSNGGYYAHNSYATKEGSSDLRSLVAVYGWADHWGTAGTISYLYGGSFGVEAGSGKYVTNAVGVRSYASGWGRTTNAIGFEAEVESYGSATPPTKLAGADLTVQVQSGGGVDIMGTNIHTWHNGGGTYTNMYGTKIDMSTGSSGALTNMYGSRITMANDWTGPVSNFYGLYLDTITHSVAPTLKYGIYQAGANDKNYFAGNIGVGISVPTTMLDISGTSGTTLKIVDGNQAAGRVLTSDASGVASWASQAGGSDTQIQYNNSGALAGSANFIWDNATSTFTVTGDINYTGVLTDTSDRRFKKDIEKLDEAEITKRLMQVDVFQFRMKSPENAPLELGVMAQDLEAIFPELVRTANDRMKSKSVNYIGLIAPLIGAAKQLNQENASLKREIASVRDQSDQLRDAIEDGKRETRILFFAFLFLLGIGLYLLRRKSAS